LKGAEKKNKRPGVHFPLGLRFFLRGAAKPWAGIDGLRGLLAANGGPAVKRRLQAAAGGPWLRAAGIWELPWKRLMGG